MKKTKGFTLIELLVVIAIIALLLSVIMPALNKAKEHARALLCRSNVRQMSLGLTLYAQDNDDKTMIFDHTPGRYWFHEIAVYLGDRDYKDTAGQIVSQVMKISYCPDAKKPHELGGRGSATEAWTYQTTTGSYGMNLWLLPEGQGYIEWQPNSNARQVGQFCSAVYRAVMVCTKTGIGRKMQKTMYSCQFPIKPPRKRKSLTVQSDFCKIVDVGRNELCFLGA